MAAFFLTLMAYVASLQFPSQSRASDLEKIFEACAQKNDGSRICKYADDSAIESEILRLKAIIAQANDVLAKLVPAHDQMSDVLSKSAKKVQGNPHLERFLNQAIHDFNNSTLVKQVDEASRLIDECEDSIRGLLDLKAKAQALDAASIPLATRNANVRTLATSIVAHINRIEIKLSGDLRFVRSPPDFKCSEETLRIFRNRGTQPRLSSFFKLGAECKELVDYINEETRMDILSQTSFAPLIDCAAPNTMTSWASPVGTEKFYVARTLPFGLSLEDNLDAIIELSTKSSDGLIGSARCEKVKFAVPSIGESPVFDPGARTLLLHYAERQNMPERFAKFLDRVFIVTGSGYEYNFQSNACQTSAAMLKAISTK